MKFKDRITSRGSHLQAHHWPSWRLISNDFQQLCFIGTNTHVLHKWLTSKQEQYWSKKYFAKKSCLVCLLATHTHKKIQDVLFCPVLCLYHENASMRMRISPMEIHKIMLYISLHYITNTVIWEGIQKSEWIWEKTTVGVFF